MEESTTLFLGDLSVFCTEKDIRKLFRSFGSIEAIRVKRGSSSKTNLSYGFIKFTERESAENAYQQLSGVMFMGRALRIGWAEGKGGIKTLRDDLVAPKRSDTAQIHVSFISKQVEMLISEATLRSLFGIYGEVVDVALKKSQFDKNLRVQNGYGFVHYAFSPDGIRSALTAVQCLHQVTIDRVTYDCSISHALQQYLLAANNPALVPYRTTHPSAHPAGAFDSNRFPLTAMGDLSAAEPALDPRLLGGHDHPDGSAAFRPAPSLPPHDPAVEAGAAGGGAHFQGGHGDFHPANQFGQVGYAPYAPRAPLAGGMGGGYGYGQPFDSAQRQRSFSREHFGSTSFSPPPQQQQYPHMHPPHTQPYAMPPPLSSPNQPPSPGLALPGQALRSLAGRGGSGAVGSTISASRPNSATSNGSGPDTLTTRASSGSSGGSGGGNTISPMHGSQSKSLSSAQEYLLSEEDVPVRYSFNLNSLPAVARSATLSISSTGSSTEDVLVDPYSPLGGALPPPHTFQRESPKVRLSAFPSGVDEDLSGGLQTLGLESSDSLLNYLHYSLAGPPSEGNYSGASSKGGNSYQLPLSSSSSSAALSSQGQAPGRGHLPAGSSPLPARSPGGPVLSGTTNSFGVYSAAGYGALNASNGYRDLLGGTTPPSEQSELDLADGKRLAASDGVVDGSGQPFTYLRGVDEGLPIPPPGHRA